MARLPMLPADMSQPALPENDPDYDAGIVGPAPEPDIGTGMREIDPRAIPGLEFLQRPENDVDQARPPAPTLIADRTETETPAAPDPMQEWEGLRQRRRARASGLPETPAAPPVGTSPLARDMDQTIQDLTRENHYRRQREADDAIRRSLESAGQWTRTTVEQIPGGFVQGAGSALQAPDVIHARTQYAAQEYRLLQMQAMEALDAGESFDNVLRMGPPRGAAGPFSGHAPIADRFAAFANAYRNSDPALRAQERARIESEFSSFNPTPIQNRPLYQAGEAVQQAGRNLVGLPEGYDESSNAVQVGRGLGSVLLGIPVRAIAGIGGAATLFGGMGMGEATQRAVQFDQTERAAGRPGLTQEQIIASGLMGVGPGTTDLLPLENLLRITRMPGPLRASIARSIGAVGGQVIIEGAQEGGQQFLQNLIAWHIYNPNQVLTQDVLGNLIVGGEVGGISAVAGQTVGALSRRVRGGGQHTQPPASPAEPAAGTPATSPAISPTPVPQATPSTPEPAIPVESPATPASPFGDLERFAPVPQSGPELDKLETSGTATEPASAPLQPSLGEPEQGDPDAEFDAAVRAAIRRDFQTYLQLERRVQADESTTGAPSQLRQDLAEAAESLVEQFRIAGLPGDGLERGARPVESIDDIRRAFREASPEELARYWVRDRQPDALPSPESNPPRIAAMATPTEPVEPQTAPEIASLTERIAAETSRRAEAEARIADMENQVAAMLPSAQQAINEILAPQNIQLSEDDVRSVVRSMLVNQSQPQEALQDYAIQAYEQERTARGQPETIRSAAAQESGRAAAPAAAGTTAPATGAAPAGAATANRIPGGARQGSAGAQELGSGRDRPGTTGTAQQPGGAERGVRAEPTVAPLLPQQRDIFNRILTSKQPLKWAEVGKQVVALPGQMEALQQEALNQGLLRQNRHGHYRRNPAAVAAAQEAGMRALAAADPRALSIPAEVRVDNAIRIREAQTGQPIGPLVRGYAIRLLDTLGGPAWPGIFNGIKRNKDLKVADLRDLAHLAGYPVKAKATKAEAYASIEKRHKDQKAFLERNGVTQQALAAFSGMPFGVGDAIGKMVERIRLMVLDARYPNEKTTGINPLRSLQADQLAIERAIDMTPYGERLRGEYAKIVALQKDIHGTWKKLAQKKGTAWLLSGKDRERLLADLEEQMSRVDATWERIREQIRTDREHTQLGLKHRLNLGEPANLNGPPQFDVIEGGKKDDGGSQSLFAFRSDRQSGEEASSGELPDVSSLTDEDIAIALTQLNDWFLENGLTFDLSNEEVRAGAEYLAQGFSIEEALEKLETTVDDQVETSSPLRPFVRFIRRLFGMRQELGNIQGTQPPRFTPSFVARYPEVASEIESFTRRMLPADVAVRVVDQIVSPNGHSLAGLYSADLNPLRGTFNAVVQIAMANRFGTAPESTGVMKRASIHEAGHGLREYGRGTQMLHGPLFTDKEWALVVERAKKVNIDAEITYFDENGNKQPAIPEYRKLYQVQALDNRFAGPTATARIEELLNQERVFGLAEKWLEGRRFGQQVDTLLERIVRFFEAVRNALRGLGFQTYEDVFDRMVSGEIADRADGGRKEPTFSPFPNTPSPAQIHLSSEEGRMAVEELLGTASPESMFAIRAFHGSPHDFDRFDSSQINSGEGSQMEGWGLYFAEHPSIGNWYKEGLERAKVDGKPVDIRNPKHIAAVSLLAANGDADMAANGLREALTTGQVEKSGLKRRVVDDALVLVQKKAALPAATLESHIYEVEIDADPDHFLDLDKPLSEQTDFVKQAIKRAGVDPNVYMMSDVNSDIFSLRHQRKFPVRLDPSSDVHHLIKGRAAVEQLGARRGPFGLFSRSPKQVSEKLRRAGLVGSKYLDAASRKEGEGTANYVVFPGNEHLINVISKDGKPLGAEDGGAQQLFAIRAFHGSPHDFDRFDSNRIGTGEGAQAFGHGLYFAGNEQVAQTYSRTEQDFDWSKPTEAAAYFMKMRGNDRAGAIKLAEQFIASPPMGTPRKEKQAFREALDLLRRGDEIPQTSSGRLYEVSLDVEPEQLLDWDKALSEQSPQVREALEKLGVREVGTRPTVGEGWTEVDPNVYGPNGNVVNDVGSQIYFRLRANRTTIGGSKTDPALQFPINWQDDTAASKALVEAGIPGIRYLDQGSRNKGEGTYNYVIFDDSLVKIVAKDGKPVSTEERADVIAQTQSDKPQGTGLPMDASSRLARAREQGFDTSQVWHHGTARAFSAFDPSRTMEHEEHGSWLTSSQEAAEYFADNAALASADQPRVMGLFIRGRLLEVAGPQTFAGTRVDAIMAQARQDSYDGVLFRDMQDDHTVSDQLVVFDPRNIRSVNAAFDPREEGSSQLLASFRSDDGQSGARPQSEETRDVSGFPNLSVTESIKESGERIRKYFVKPETEVTATEAGSAPLLPSQGQYDLSPTPSSQSRSVRASDENATLVYRVAADGEITLASLRTNWTEYRKGHGSRLLDGFLAATDAAGRQVRLNAVALDSEGMDQDALVRFYESRGFVVAPGYTAPGEGPEMVRLPASTGQSGVRPVTDAAPENSGLSFIVSEQPDGSWELTFFKADDGSKVQSIVEAIESDIGNRLSPRGWLTPSSYRHWQAIAPDRVRYHQDGGETFGGMFASPRAVEFAQAVYGQGGEDTNQEINRVVSGLQKSLPPEAFSNERREEMYSFSSEKPPGGELAREVRRILSPRNALDRSPQRQSLRHIWEEEVVRDPSELIEMIRSIDPSILETYPTLLEASRNDAAPAPANDAFGPWDAGYNHGAWQNTHPPRLRHPINTGEDDGSSSQSLFAFSSDRGRGSDKPQGTGLPMDASSRLARAREQGFDTSQVWYHGTEREFEAFSLDAVRATGESDIAIALTDSPHLASGYAGTGPIADYQHWQGLAQSGPGEVKAQGGGGRVLPTYVRLRNPMRVTQEEWGSRGENADLIEAAKAKGHDGIIFTYTGFDTPIREALVFDPANIRSVNAAFDPNEGASTQLLAAFSSDRGSGGKPDSEAVRGVSSLPISLARIEPMADAKHSVAIMRGPDRIGDIDFDIKNKGTTAAIAFISVEPGVGRLSMSDISQLREAFRLLHPKVTKFEGERNSGAKGAAIEAGRSVDPFQSVVLAAFSSDRGGASPYMSPPGQDAQPSQGEPQAPVKSLADIIQSIKDTLGLTVTQGRYGLTVSNPSTGYSRRFRPQANVRGQYMFADGVARIRIVTDINAIAHEGGHHLENVYGDPLRALMREHAEEIASPPVRDVAMPTLAPSGFSGLDLDADTQATLVRAGEALRQRSDLVIAGRRGTVEFQDAEVRAGTARRTLERRLGPTVANALIGDLVGDATQPNGGIIGQSPYRVRADAMSRPGQSYIDPGVMAQYVAERYSRSGTPTPRAPQTFNDRQVSEGFAEFFRRYLLEPQAVQREMPGFTVAFEEFLDAADPALLENLERAQLTVISEEFKAHKNATATERVVANSASTIEPSAFDQVKDFYNTRDQGEIVSQWLSTYSYNVMDQTNPALKIKQQVLGDMFERGIRDADGRPIALRLQDDPHYHFRMFPQAFKIGHEFIVNGYTNYGDLTPKGPHLQGAIAHALGGTGRAQWNKKAMARFGGYIEAQAGIAFWAFYAKQNKLPEAEAWAATVNQYFNSPDVAQMLAAGIDAPQFESQPSHAPFAEYWQAIREMEAANPSYRDASRMAREWQHNGLTLKWQAGLITDQEYARLSKHKDFHAPFQRKFEDDEGAFVPEGTSSGGFWTGFKRRKGSQRLVINPLASMAREAYQTAEIIQRNDMMLAFAHLSDRSGPGGGRIIERITKEETMVANERTFARIEEAVAAMGYGAADAKALSLQMEGDIEDGSELHFLWDPEHKGPKGAVTLPLFERGERKLVRFNDIENGRRLLAAMNAFGRGMSSTLLNIAAVPAGVLRAGVVMHPAYILGNFAGDVQQTWALTGATPVWTHMRGGWHELSSYPKFRRFVEMFGVKPSDVAQMQDRLGLIGGGQLTASIAERSGNRKNLDLIHLRKKGYQVVDIQAWAATGTAAGGGVAGGLLGTAAAPIIGGVAGGATGVATGAALGAHLGEAAMRRLRGDTAIADMQLELKSTRRKIKALDRKSDRFDSQLVALRKVEAEQKLAIENLKAADKALSTRFARGVGRVVGGTVGGLTGAATGAVAAPAMGPVVGATLGLSAGAMVGRLLFGAGAEAAFAKVSEFTETAGRRGTAEFITKRAMSVKHALTADPAMPLIDAMRQGVYTANDVLPFDRRGFLMGPLLRIIPFLGGNTQAISKMYRQAWMVEGDRGRIITAPALQGGLLGAGGAAAATAIFGGPPGWAMGAGALTGAALGRWALGPNDMEAMKLYLRHMLTRRNMKPGELTEFQQNYSPRDENNMRAGLRAWIALSIVGMAGAAVWMMSGGGDTPEEYDNVNRQTKNTHWVYKLYGIWVRMKRFEIGMPAIITEAIMDAAFKGDPRLAERVRDGLVATHSPPLIPTLMQDATVMTTGVDPRTGRTITPYFMRDLPPHMRRSAYSSEFARQWAEALNKLGIRASPIQIDYMLQSQGGYWGREAQIISNWFSGRNRGEWRDVPIIGQMINRFGIDPERAPESRRVFMEIMGGSAQPYREAAGGYRGLLRDGEPSDVSRSALAAMPASQREYAVLMAHFSQADRNRHPLNRADQIVRINDRMLREIIDRGLVSTQPGSNQGRPIELAPAKRGEVMRILLRIQDAELWNALVDTRVPGFAGRNITNPTPMMQELEASHPAVFAEMNRRRTHNKLEGNQAAPVGNYEQDRASWITVQSRVRDMVTADDLVGLRPARDRAFRRSMQRGGIRYREQDSTVPQVPIVPEMGSPMGVPY